MRKFDKDGLILCEMQGQVFEMSIETTSTSSEIFIRRFMQSIIAKSLDSGDILQTNIQPKDIFERIIEQYGSVKYSPNEMYWIGYIYRYFSYTYEKSSSQVYKIIKPKELRELFFAYHTMDPSQAIERILEAKGYPINEEEELKRQYEIFRRIRKGS